MNGLKRFALRLSVFVGACLQFGALASAQSIGDTMVATLAEKLNQRLGGGESDHLATEALRIAGGEFVPSDLGNDYPSSGDKVWGSLVTVISCNNSSWIDTNPANLCQAGDVIQFGSAVFDSVSFPQQFTGVVAAVDSNGRPTSIYVQNFNGNRVVQQRAIDTRQLSAGWLRIYHPQARIDRFNEWKFTIVNNDSQSQTYDLLDGIDTIITVTLTAANNTGSFTVHSVTTDGTVPNFLLYNETSYFVEMGKGNEVFSSTNGLAVRQLSQ